MPVQNDISEYLAAIISVLGSVLAWIIADAKSKSRISYIEEKVLGIKNYQDEISKEHSVKLSENDIQIAKIEQENAEIHRGLDRLDGSKASKEVVDGFRNEITTLRIDMDKRFDRIERMLEKEPA